MHRRITELAIVVVAVGAALLVRWGLDPWLNERAPSLTMLLAIAAVSAIGGCWPGLLATLLGGVLANVFFVEPRGSIDFSKTTSLIQFLLFLGVGVGISTIAEYRLRSQRRAQRADEAAAREARRNQIILESISDGFIALDGDWRFTYVNTAAERIFQRKRRDMRGRVIWDLFPHLRDTDVQQEFETVVVQGTASSFETQSFNKSAWFDIVAYPCERGVHDAQCMTAFFHDITQRKEAQRVLIEHGQRLEQEVREQTRQLEQAQQVLHRTERLASLGTLSAGITHDIGNLMLPVRIRLQALQRMNLPSEAYEHLQTINDASSQLVDLTNLLRGFAIDPFESAASDEAVNLAELCTKSERLHRSVLPDHVQLQCDVPPELPPASVSPPCLTQAMLNLVINAGEAIDPGRDGVVAINARQKSATELQIRIEDNGRGMSAEEVEHCLEPFYTTKTRAISTGLGLSLVHGIIKAVGGSIDVQSPAPGRQCGTRITLVVPIANDAKANAKPGVAAVLLRDDRLAAMFTTMLELAGWTVQRLAEPQQVDETELLVTEAAQNRLEVAKKYRKVSPKGAIIAIGDPDESWSELGATMVDTRPSPATVRRAMAQTQHH